MKTIISILTLLFSFSYADLITPENGSHLNYIHVLFEWEQEADADSYNLQLDTSPSFNSSPFLINNFDSSGVISISGNKWANVPWITKPLLQISRAGDTTSSNDIVPKFSIAVSHESQAAGVTALSIVEGTPFFELDLN